MLKNTFCHIPGIGEKLERSLWGKGLLSWDLCSGKDNIHSRKILSFNDHIDESFGHLRDENPNYFADLLPASEHWRLFSEFRHATAYLDIETNGLAGPGAYITTISVYDGRSVHYYVKGKNLEDFKNDIKKYKVIVTFNGRCFDIPFIESYLKISMKQAHIDLRFILKDLGFTGGLKNCEKRLGIERGELDGVDGYFAVLLWRDYRENKNQKALETLLAYNIQDVVNLEPLMITSYNLKLEGTPFLKSHRLPMPYAPKLPFNPDPKTIRKIFHRYSRHYAMNFD